MPVPTWRLARFTARSAPLHSELLCPLRPLPCCELYSPVRTSALRVVTPSAPAAMLRPQAAGRHAGGVSRRRRMQANTSRKCAATAPIHHTQRLMSVDNGTGEHAAAAAPTCMDQLSGSRAAAGAQRIVRPCTRAVARADERKRQGGDRRVELGGLCGAEGFFCRGLFQEHRRPSRPGTKES